MVIEPKETTIAYRCPECGAIIYSAVGILALSGDMVKLKCACGGSELILENTRDGKIRFTVPCIFCPHPHSFLVSRKTVLSRDLFAFPCSYAGFDVCFIGKKEAVEAAVAEADRELCEALSEEDRQALHEKNGELSDYTDEHMADLILFTLGDLHDEGKIFCGCSDGGDFLCERREQTVAISCKKCGYGKEFYAFDCPDTHALLDADELHLEKDF